MLFVIDAAADTFDTCSDSQRQLFVLKVFKQTSESVVYLEMFSIVHWVFTQLVPC